MLDFDRWIDLCDRLGYRSDVLDEFRSMAAAYNQPHRFYHNAHHIADCLHQFDTIRHAIDRPDEVEVAIWFHDVVYDTHASDNEELSADWADGFLLGIGVHSEIRGRIRSLILATKHQQKADSAEAQWMLDIDLSILGRDPDTFGEYDNAIRREYDWVPELTYRTARAAILEGFCNRDAIYHHQTFRDRFEIPARRNLSDLIRRLRDS